MSTITTETARHTDLGEYSLDASDLGLAPGVWPSAIRVGEKLYTAPVPQRDREGDLVCVTYFTSGSRLTLWND